MESAEKVKLTQGEDDGCTMNEVYEETLAATQEGECGTTNDVSVQNTASSLHLEHSNNVAVVSTQGEEHDCTTNIVVVVSTQDEEHVQDEEQVVEPGKLMNDTSNDLQEISGKTIDRIFLEVCASQAVATEHIVPSSLASPSDDELPLSSLLPRGFKMKKGVKSEKNETKNMRITRSRKN